MTHGVIKAYSGYLIKKRDLISSASGGIAYAISLKTIEQNGGVYSVKYSDDFRLALWAKAERKEDLEAFKGSKYVESRKVYEGFNLYKEIKEDLDNNKLVTAIGLPCDIGAIKAYLKKDYPNLNLVDLVCHGPTIKKVADDYLTSLEKKYKSKIKNFTVRYKKEGKWTPPYLRAEFDNGKVFLKPFYSTDYGIAFSILSQNCCYSCHFKGENHKSDLTIGDYWGLREDNKEEWNESGVSIAFVRTDKGQTLINNISDICKITETDTYFAMDHNRLMNEKKEKHPKYDKFLKDLNEKGLHKAVRRNIALRRFIRNLIPEPLVPILKKIMR